MLLEITKEELEVELSRAIQEVVLVEEFQEEGWNVVRIFIPKEKDPVLLYTLRSGRDFNFLWRQLFIWTMADGFRTAINNRIKKIKEEQSRLDYIKLRRRKQDDKEKERIRQLERVLVIEENPDINTKEE